MTQNLKCKWNIDCDWEVLSSCGVWPDDIEERRKLYHHVAKYKECDINIYRPLNIDGKYDTKIKLMEDKLKNLKISANI